MEKFCWQNHCGSLHAATPVRFTRSSCKKTIVLPMQPQHEAIYTAGTILQLQSTMEFHGQLIHQHHLQSHLHCGNDPTVANHNGIPSATHPPAPLAIPFTLRERSYSCKSQWNSVDRKCTKNTWNPIYNAEPIRTWSETVPTTHETVSHPSHRRGRSSTFGDGLCMEKHRVSCICYLSKTHFVRDFLQNSIGNSSTSTTCNPHLHCGNDPTVANHNGILSTALHEKHLKPHLQCGTDPTMIRPWSENDPTTHETVSHPSHRRGRSSTFETDFVRKNIGFRASAISQKRISCETSFKTPSATPPPAPLAIPFAVRERS